MTGTSDAVITDSSSETSLYHTENHFVSPDTKRYNEGDNVQLQPHKHDKLPV